LETPEIELRNGPQLLARFRIPLSLPARTRPEPKLKTETAGALAQSGWQHYLFARFPEAETAFRRALQKDAQCAAAHTGLALLLLERDPAGSRAQAEAALLTQPDSGLAHFTLANGWLNENDAAALDAAWQAALDPATASAGRGLVARLFIGQHKYQEALAALSNDGPWQSDPLCRARRAFVHLMLGEKDQATPLARANLKTDPLDLFALSVLWLGKVDPEATRFEELVSGNPEQVLALTAALVELKQEKIALDLLTRCYLDRVDPKARTPLALYWAEFLTARVPGSKPLLDKDATGRPQLPVFPSDPASVPVLREALTRHPGDGRPALYLGHLLFHLGRLAEGRAMWQRAAQLGASPEIAFRALGMASLTTDNDPVSAEKYLAQAHQADSTDPIIARDLGRVLLAQAEKSLDSARQHELWSRARATLQAAFPKGKSRSDFVCLLAKTQNQLGDYAATAGLLDSVRITVWEGSHEAHDLFEEAHLALGRSYLKANHAKQALQEFDRALDYPENLAIGRLEEAPQAHIQRLRAEALTALGLPEAARRALDQAGPQVELK